MIIEFTDEELKSLNFFEPQKAKNYLNDLLTQKIAGIVERVEKQMRERYCDHEKVFYSPSADGIICEECERKWT